MRQTKNKIVRLHVEGDGLAGEGLDENLHVEYQKMSPVEIVENVSMIE